MSSFSVMDWNAKTPLRWDWENTIMANAKAAEITKFPVWGIEVDGGIDDGPLYSSGGGDGYGGDGGSGSGYAGSDVGHVYSSNRSKSASVDSSSIEKASEFCFGEFEGFHDYLIEKKELHSDNQTGNPQICGTSVRSAEPLIGLKLGKRTYFEDLSPLSNGKASSASIHLMSSAPTVKRSRPSYQNTSPSCQVEGCNLDLSSAKEYHRKHRICDYHSKFPKVVVKGRDCRFCQQCSRFHDLQAFDEKKRSCRKRLSDHNARRRKPQHDAIHFNSPRQGSLFYEDRQRVGLNGFAFGHTSPAGKFTLESSFNPKFTLTKDGSLMPANTRGHDGQVHLRRNQQNAVNMLYHNSKCSLPSKGGTGIAEIPSEDLEERMISTNSDAAQGYRRALSLLSNYSCGSTEPNAAFITHPTAITNSMATTNGLANPVATTNPVAVTSTKRPYQGLPLAASYSWLTTEQSSDIRMDPPFIGQNNGNGHFPQYQQWFKLPGSDF